jgi:microsomal epoxide hydrolase
MRSLIGNSDASERRAERRHPSRGVVLQALLALFCSTGSAMTPAIAAVTVPPARAAFSDESVLTPDGVRIHYIQGGSPDGRPTVVFVPGWTWSGSVWEAQMASLAPTHRVVAMDPRSQGDSSKVADGNTPEQRAEDIAALLDQLGPDPVVLVGWSQGVQDVAAYVDNSGTSRLAGVVLVDASFAAGSTSVADDPAGTRQLLDRMAIYAAHPKAYLAGMMDASRAHPFTSVEKERLAGLSLKTPTSTGVAMLISDLLTTDRRAIASKIDKPALVFASETSAELGAIEKMTNAIRGARLHVVKGAGHALFLDQPTQFSDDLARFVDGLNVAQ